MIKKIMWNNDDVLGDLCLDFVKSDGNVYDTIVIAGENGAGKTRVLETLSTFLNLGTMEPFKEIVYTANGSTFSIMPIDSSARYGFHKRRNILNGTEITISSNKVNNFPSIEADKYDLRHYGCVYTKARSGFVTKPVKTSTTQQIDTEKYGNDAEEDFTKVKQLLIDIRMQDNEHLAREQAAGNIRPYSQFFETSKTYRFQKAFNSFFDSLAYEGIDLESSDEMKVVFKKNNKTINIDSLSTGEKQIVFRGAYLLRYSNSLDDGVILVDEPELSMHPKWQEKIFDYYRSLFAKNGRQTVQMIFATHSEYVIRSALKSADDVLVIILSDDNGRIRPDRISEMVLPSRTAAEVNYLAFGVKTIDYHIALYGDLQTQTGKSSIWDMDAYIALQPEYIVALHEKNDTTHGHYKTLPTYIRNAIDHPDSGRSYSEAELARSIELLRTLCRRHRANP